MARRALTAEADAIGNIRLDGEAGAGFVRAVDVVAALGVASADRFGGGALVVSGMGKSGLIGQKLSATFASTGTPSHYLHAAEATHGDLGRLRRGDAALLLSYSGSTGEVVTLAELLRQDGVPVLAITSGAARRPNDLFRLADVHLSIGDVTEACPHNLAPTASTTAMLALGDALAMAVAARRRFAADDFHRLHPSGSLGRQLRPIVEALRFKSPLLAGSEANLALVPASATIRQGYERCAEFAERAGVRRAGALVVVDEDQRLAGVFTDGDLRRHVMAGGTLDVPLAGVMTREPRCLRFDAVVRDAVHLVRERRIDELPVLDADGRPIGLIDVQDLVALKVIEG